MKHYTLIQFHHGACGDQADYRSWLVPVDRVTPGLKDLLARVHGKTSLQCAKADMETLYAALNELTECACGGSDPEAVEPVHLGDGDAITCLCQVFFDPPTGNVF